MLSRPLKEQGNTSVIGVRTGSNVQVVLVVGHGGRYEGRVEQKAEDTLCCAVGRAMSTDEVGVWDLRCAEKREKAGVREQGKSKDIYEKGEGREKNVIICTSSPSASNSSTRAQILLQSDKKRSRSGSNGAKEGGNGC